IRAEQIHRHVELQLIEAKRMELEGCEIIHSGDTGLVAMPSGERAARKAALLGLSAYVKLLLKPSGIYFLHAGAVERDGKALVFAGENDSGKSTLVRRFVLEGWKFIADDNLPVMRAGACFLGEAFYVGQLEQEGIERLVREGFTPVALPGFLRAPRCGGDPVEIRAIIFLEKNHENGTGEIIYLQRKEALGKLLALSKTPLTDDDYENFLDVLIGVVQQADCYEMKFNPVSCMKIIEPQMNTDKQS
ncbi:MAG: hypothetical protein AB1546_02085, partial [bacterium]